jgi:hypothetical protein
MVCVSTDDFLCAFTHQHLFDDLCGSLRKYFELMTKEGPKLSYLNPDIHQDSHEISIDQTAHIREIDKDWFPEAADLHTTNSPFCTDNKFEQILSEALPAEPDELSILEQQYGGPFSNFSRKIPECQRMDTLQIMLCMLKIRIIQYCSHGTSISRSKKRCTILSHSSR